MAGLGGERNCIRQKQLDWRKGIGCKAKAMPAGHVANSCDYRESRKIAKFNAYPLKQPMKIMF
jgi:hypothetical protein